MVKFLNNKYHRWYYDIVHKARVRGTPDGYYEKHHVVPKCMGGKNTWHNTVNLTYREHFLVHWLLTKMTTGQYKRKMLSALFYMTTVGPDNKHGRITPIWLCVLAKKVHREAQIGSKHSEESRIKMRNSHLGKNMGEKNGFFGRKHSAEALEKFRNYKPSAETLDRLREARLGKRHTAETRAKISKGNLGRKVSEETRAKMSGENHPMYGKNHTVEAREKIRAGLCGKMSGEDNPFYGKKHKVESLVNMRKRPSIRSKSGMRGVSKLKTGYSSRIRIDGRVEYLGYFKTSDEAVMAYEKALLRIEGDL